MDSEQRKLRLANYFVYYYDELRNQILKSGVDPESLPPHLRGHWRYIELVECRDGYVVFHYANHNNRYNANTPEGFKPRFDRQNETVGEVVEEYILGGSSWHTYFPYQRSATTGRYELLQPWERRDVITNSRIERWNAQRWRAQTGEEAITQAKEDLQDYFGSAASA